MLAGTIKRGKTEVPLGEAGYKVVAVMFFGKKESRAFGTTNASLWFRAQLSASDVELELA